MRRSSSRPLLPARELKDSIRHNSIEVPLVYTATGALHSFGAVDNVAQALSRLPVGSRSWIGRCDPAEMPDQYRTCATLTKAAAERMVGGRDTYLSGAA
jgi:hypothetical protein